MCALPSNSMPGTVQHTAVLFSVNGFQFVIEADLVDEIRGLEGMEKIVWTRSRVNLPKVTHVLHRGRRNFFLVDAGNYFRFEQSQAARILLLRKKDVGVLVDGVDRMVEFGAVYPLPEAFAGEERSWYLGLTFLQQRVVPVVNTASFITDDELTLLRDAAHLPQIEAASERTRVQAVKDWGLRSGGRG